MDPAEASQLGAFRRLIERADTEALLPLVGVVIDDLVDMMRIIPGASKLAIEMAAAVSAEIHRRHQPTIPAQHAKRVGTA